MKYVVMFSGGICSWAAAQRVVAQYGAENVICLFCDVKGDNPNPHVGEDEDTYRFIDDAIAQLGCEYVRLADGRDIWQIFRERRYLGNSRIAPCSHILKQQPAWRWLKTNTTSDTHTIVIGIDWSEIHRVAVIQKAYKPWNTLFPMCEEPYLSKHEMIDWANSLGVKPPRLYSFGFAHNNCGGGCVKAGQAQFRQLLELMPERYDVWEKGEEDMRQFLDKDVSMLKQMKNGVITPLTLNELRKRTPKQLDMLDFGGCGCFVDGFSMDD